MISSTAERIQDIIASNAIVLFMKGVPAAPRCGFSAAVVQILSRIDVPFTSVDVLSDPEIREGIKEFSNWPTIPQLYVKGEFVGGLRHRPGNVRSRASSPHFWASRALAVATP